MMNARNGPNQQLDPSQIMQQHMQQLNLNEIHRIQAGAFFNNPPPQQPGKLLYFKNDGHPIFLFQTVLFKCQTN